MLNRKVLLTERSGMENARREAGTTELFIHLTVSGINAIITDHFEILFRDMLHEELDKLDGRDCFFNINVIFMAIVMKSDGIIFFIVTSILLVAITGLPRYRPTYSVTIFGSVSAGFAKT